MLRANTLIVLIGIVTVAACRTAAPSLLPDGETTRQAWVEHCTDWDDWDKPAPPFQIHANSYHVGTCGISAILIVGDDGHMLIDGGTDTGAEVIAANIEALGYDLSDIAILLHSHEHFDHVGGLAKLQALTGADLYASSAAAPVLRSGNVAASDPQFGLHEPFTGARVDKVVEDREVVTLGHLSLTAIATPGHSPGALSWQWESCDVRACETVVYADSLSPVSADHYRFSDHLDYLRSYQQGLTEIGQIDCTLLMTPHPSASQMRRRLMAGQLSDAQACANYSAALRDRLADRLMTEQSAP